MTTRKRRDLTHREWAVANCVADGMSNAEIAAQLRISTATTKRHLNTIMIKWNCRNRTEVAIRAIKGPRDAPGPSSMVG